MPNSLSELQKCLGRPNAYRFVGGKVVVDSLPDVYCHPFHHHGSTRFVRWLESGGNRWRRMFKVKTPLEDFEGDASREDDVAMRDAARTLGEIHAEMTSARAELLGLIAAAGMPKNKA